MKKVVIAILSFLMLACVSQLVQGRGFDLAVMSNHPQSEKTKIKLEELPQTARTTLNGNAFKGWVAENVYKLSNGEFEVELKKGDTTQIVKFNKDGKVK